MLGASEAWGQDAASGMSKAARATKTWRSVVLLRAERAYRQHAHGQPARRGGGECRARRRRRAARELAVAPRAAPARAKTLSKSGPLAIGLDAVWVPRTARPGSHLARSRRRRRAWRGPTVPAPQAARLKATSLSVASILVTRDSSSDEPASPVELDAVTETKCSEATEALECSNSRRDSVSGRGPRPQRRPKSR